MFCFVRLLLYLFFAHLNIVINWILYDLLALEVVAINVSKCLIPRATLPSRRPTYQQTSQQLFCCNPPPPPRRYNYGVTQQPATVPRIVSIVRRRLISPDAV